MAVDDALLDLVNNHQSPPTIRLYGWAPPCLSIGYAQSFNDLDFNSLALLGWDWVRRPTGGRAILHTDEITYSIIGLNDDPRLSGSILESYCKLAGALLAAFSILDIPADMKEIASSGYRPSNPVCFEVPSNYEITALGKKLIGSAQARRKSAVLQHGSLPLFGDLSRITNGLKFSNPNQKLDAAQKLMAHATTLETVAGKRITWDNAASAFIEAFETVLKIDLVRSGLSVDEEGLVNERLREKFDNDSWNKRL